MQKIVTNRCYGGFGLSEQAMQRYAEIKGISLYPESDAYDTTYWTVPEDQRPKLMNWSRASAAERAADNEAHNKAILYAGDISRDDPDLIQTVEELGKAANDDHADLKVTEIPDGVEWEIEEYDGLEHITEAHRTW